MRDIWFTHSRCWEVQGQGASWCIPGEHPLHDLQVLVFSLCPPMAGKRSSGVASSPSEGVNQIPMMSSKPDYLPTAPPLNTITFKGRVSQIWWGWRRHKHQVHNLNHRWEKSSRGETQGGEIFFSKSNSQSGKDEISLIPKVIIFVLHHAEHRYSFQIFS